MNTRLISFFVVTQLMISSKSITALCLGFLFYLTLRGANKLLLPQIFKSTHIVNIKAKINASARRLGISALPIFLLLVPWFPGPVNRLHVESMAPPISDQIKTRF